MAAKNIACATSRDLHELFCSESSEEMFSLTPRKWKDEFAGFRMYYVPESLLLSEFSKTLDMNREDGCELVFGSYTLKPMSHGNKEASRKRCTLEFDPKTFRETPWNQQQT